MIFLGKEKAEVRLLQHGKGLFRRHVNLDTQGLKQSAVPHSEEAARLPCLLLSRRLQQEPWLTSLKY